MSKTTEGVQCSHTLGRKSILFVIKVLEFLKSFSKGFKRSARQSLAAFRADRVVVPSGSRQYLSVCRRDFPMQGDVAPKAWNCSKTFMRIPSVGYALFAHPRRVIFSFCHKSFGILKTFFQKVLSGCGQSPRPFSPRPSRVLFFAHVSVLQEKG